MQNLLPKATLGRTGLEVTRLGFGCALWRPNITHWTPGQAATVWNTALDEGINFFDTAYDYVYSEEWIGKILKPRYGEFYLATKGGCTDSLPTSNDSDHVWTRDNLFRNIETSLRRLNRDNLDIIQLHNATVEQCEKGNLVKALSDIKDQGLVKWIGPTLLEWGSFDVMQIPYSALEREHEDWITKAATQGVGIIIRGGVAQGEHGVGRGSSEIWDTFQKAFLDDLMEEGESQSSFVLRYTLSHPHVDTIIVGTTRTEHLQENINAAKMGPLPADIYLEAKKRLDSIGERPTHVF